MAHGKWWQRWLNNCLWTNRTKPRPARRPARPQLYLEALEDRAVPAVLTVTSAFDTIAVDVLGSYPMGKVS